MNENKVTSNDAFIEQIENLDSDILKEELVKYIKEHGLTFPERDILNKIIDKASIQMIAPYNSRLLTGKELRIAALCGLKVRYKLVCYDNEPYHQFDDICVMEKANKGYYIGPTDINPEVFGNNEDVIAEEDDGWFAVYAVEGVNYSHYQT